jgi:hypothetical protein
MLARAVLGIGVVLALWGVLAPPTAGAHSPRPAAVSLSDPMAPGELSGPTETATPSPLTPGPGWGWSVAAALALAAAGIGGRRTAALAALAGILVFTHESGVHGVHHLGNDAAAAACEVAAAGSTVMAATDTSPGWLAPVAGVTAACVEGEARRPAVLARSSMQVRAPPRPS